MIAAMMAAEEERQEEMEGMEKTFFCTEEQAGKVDDEKAGRNKEMQDIVPIICGLRRKGEGR